MDEVYPVMMKDWYIYLTPLLRWICFGIDLFAILCMYSVTHIYKKSLHPVMRLLIWGVMIQTGTRAFAIMQGAELFINPFTLCGSIGIAGASCFTVLGITGIYGKKEDDPILHVKMRQEFILDHKDSKEVID